jgi:hypothetical protein
MFTGKKILRVPMADQNKDSTRQVVQVRTRQ